MRQSKHYPIPDAKSFLRNLLTFGNREEHFCLLNSNRSVYIPGDKYSRYDLLAGIGSIEELKAGTDSFGSLRAFHAEHKDWLFGYLGYDLKNETANLDSQNFDGHDFPSIHFFRPRHVIALRGNNCEIFFGDDEAAADKLFSAIGSADGSGNTVSFSVRPEIKQRVRREEYLKDITGILTHIQRGDVYELNYCQEFYSDDVVINPVETYWQLNEFSPMPFSCFYRLGEKYLM
ncbi:MAG: chorismate-binding protein, partial [Bacteroidia bacterium]|nr:chorismate-binding protein [Bacteroidia bacterium]